MMGHGDLWFEGIITVNRAFVVPLLINPLKRTSSRQMTEYISNEVVCFDATA